MTGPTIYLRGIPFEVSPGQTPFDEAGKPPKSYRFIYFTNRSVRRWSYLLHPTPNGAIIREVYRLDSPGFTQLWIFEKRFGVHPPGGKSMPQEPPGFTIRNPRYPEGLQRKDWPGQLFVVLREPLQNSGAIHDVLSYHQKEEAAIESARRYTAKNHRRSVVGLLHGDIYWH